MTDPDDLLAYAQRQTQRHDGHANDETVEITGYDLNILLAAVTDLVTEVDRLNAENDALAAAYACPHGIPGRDCDCEADVARPTPEADR